MKVARIVLLLACVSLCASAAVTAASQDYVTPSTIWAKVTTDTDGTDVTCKAKDGTFEKTGQVASCKSSADDSKFHCLENADGTENAKTCIVPIKGLPSGVKYTVTCGADKTFDATTTAIDFSIYLSQNSRDGTSSNENYAATVLVTGQGDAANNPDGYARSVKCAKFTGDTDVSTKKFADLTGADAKTCTETQGSNGQSWVCTWADTHDAATALKIVCGVEDATTVNSNKKTDLATKSFKFTTPAKPAVVTIDSVAGEVESVAIVTTTAYPDVVAYKVTWKALTATQKWDTNKMPEAQCKLYDGDTVVATQAEQTVKTTDTTTRAGTNQFVSKKNAYFAPGKAYKVKCVDKWKTDNTPSSATTTPPAVTVTIKSSRSFNKRLELNVESNMYGHTAVGTSDQSFMLSCKAQQGDTALVIGDWATNGDSVATNGLQNGQVSWSGLTHPTTKKYVCGINFETKQDNVISAVKEVSTRDNPVLNVPTATAPNPDRVVIAVSVTRPEYSGNKVFCNAIAKPDGAAAPIKLTSSGTPQSLVTSGAADADYAEQKLTFTFKVDPSLNDDTKTFLALCQWEADKDTDVAVDKQGSIAAPTITLTAAQVAAEQYTKKVSLALTNNLAETAATYKCKKDGANWEAVKNDGAAPDAGNIAGATHTHTDSVTAGTTVNIGCAITQAGGNAITASASGKKYATIALTSASNPQIVSATVAASGHAGFTLTVKSNIKGKAVCTGVGSYNGQTATLNLNTATKDAGTSWPVNPLATDDRCSAPVECVAKDQADEAGTGADAKKVAAATTSDYVTLGTVAATPAENSITLSAPVGGGAILSCVGAKLATDSPREYSAGIADASGTAKTCASGSCSVEFTKLDANTQYGFVCWAIKNQAYATADRAVPGAFVAAKTSAPVSVGDVTTTVTSTTITAKSQLSAAKKLQCVALTGTLSDASWTGATLSAAACEANKDCTVTIKDLLPNTKYTVTCRAEGSTATKEKKDVTTSALATSTSGSLSYSFEIKGATIVLADFTNDAKPLGQLAKKILAAAAAKLGVDASKVTVTAAAKTAGQKFFVKADTVLVITVKVAGVAASENDAVLSLVKSALSTADVTTALTNAGATADLTTLKALQTTPPPSPGPGPSPSSDDSGALSTSFSMLLAILCLVAWRL